MVDVADPPVATDPAGVTTEATGPADVTTEATVATDDTTRATATDRPAPSAADCGLTTEQVASVMGIEMVPLDGTCGWEAPGLEGAVVEVYVSGGDATMLGTAEGEEVAGVGDEARFDFLDVLNFRIGESYYYVQVLNMGAGGAAISSHDASVGLAKLWIARARLTGQRLRSFFDRSLRRRFSSPDSESMPVAAILSSSESSSA